MFSFSRAVHLISECSGENIVGCAWTDTGGQASVTSLGETNTVSVLVSSVPPALFSNQQTGRKGSL